MHGWIILDKPYGLGSTQAVGAVKRNLYACGLMGKGRKIKVGHGGTLDPLATGILPIALGEATKLTGRLLDASKIYDFTISFGMQTDTLDVEGQAVAESAHRPARTDVEAVLPSFVGAIEQIPPAYSALKIDGRRAYDLARAGRQVEMKLRPVTVHSLHVAALHPVGPGALDAVTLTAHVSKGTYIRSLARDIAQALGTVGHVTMLRRTKAGPFGLEQAISLDKLNEIGQGAPPEAIMLPLEAGLDDIPALVLTPDQAALVRKGRVLDRQASEDGLYWAKDANGVPVALMQIEGPMARVVRGFNM